MSGLRIQRFVNLGLVASGHGASVSVILVTTGVVVVGGCIRGVLVLSLLGSSGKCTLKRGRWGGLPTTQFGR